MTMNLLVALATGSPVAALLNVTSQQLTSMQSMILGLLAVKFGINTTLVTLKMEISVGFTA